VLPDLEAIDELAIVGEHPNQPIAAAYDEHVLPAPSHGGGQ
jgi:hypothetical protein